jgi:hypothetical protein
MTDAQLAALVKRLEKMIELLERLLKQHDDDKRARLS